METLICDLVFVVEEKIKWENSNSINKTDLIADSKRVYEEHYSHFKEHYFKRRKRYTLKANEEKSFQPQDEK